MDEDNAEQQVSPIELLNALQDRANALLASLKWYQTCLQTHSKQNEVEIRTFKRGVESEAKLLNDISLTKHHLSNPSLTEFEVEEFESKRVHALRSSNLPFYEAVWTIASQCTAITALCKKVFWESKPPAQSNGSTNDNNGILVSKSHGDRKSAVVDIIAQDGLEWIKVSTITEKRLLFQMAKEGWEAYGDYSDSDESVDANETNSNARKADQSRQLELVKLAKNLYDASRQERVHFQHPRLRFVLPKIQEGLYEDVDAVVADIRAIGIHVTCSNYDAFDGNKLSASIGNMAVRDPDQDSNYEEAQQDLTHLLPSLSLLAPASTQTLNIDCTILLALISDISHISSSELPPHPNNLSGHYHKTIIRQISSEEEHPMLPHELYPYLSNRKLVCTTHAAQRMREIVQTMGTETETVRADILLGENSYKTASADELQAALRDHYSCHSVPTDLALPIQIVEFDHTQATDSALATNGANIETGKADISSSLNVQEVERPNIDIHIMERLLTYPKINLSPINASVFLYGWTQGIVTVTSNRAVATAVVKCIGEILDEMEEEGGTSESKDLEVGQFVGPKIYVCETARSLVGKEKQGGGTGGAARPYRRKGAGAGG